MGLHENCMQCKEDYYIDPSGACMKIKNCNNQLREKCLQCNPGYYLNVFNGENEEQSNNNEEDSKKNTQKYQQKFFSFNLAANIFEI